MLPFILEYRGRALFVLGCLPLTKPANLGIPLMLKKFVKQDSHQELLGLSSIDHAMWQLQQQERERLPEKK